MQSVSITVFNVKTRYPDINFPWYLSFPSDTIKHVLPQIPRLFLFTPILSHSLRPRRCKKKKIVIPCGNIRGHAVAQVVEALCYTRKAAGSIPYGIIGFFQ